MPKVFFYCDESGAKGYANQNESSPGEVGVFAGILVPDECLAEVKPSFDAIAAKYSPPSGKLHIADLAPEKKWLCVEKFSRRSSMRTCHASGMQSMLPGYMPIIKWVQSCLRSSVSPCSPHATV